MGFYTDKYEIKELEGTCEEISNELQELENIKNSLSAKNRQILETAISNIEYANDKNYAIFEDKHNLERDYKELEQENTKLKELICELIQNDYEKQIYYRIKYNGII